MSYERTCGECRWYHGPVKNWAPELCSFSGIAPKLCDRFSQRPATADELRAELLERAEALDGVAHGIGLRYRSGWESTVVLPPAERRFGVYARVIVCVHRDGDEGIE